MTNEMMNALKAAGWAFDYNNKGWYSACKNVGEYYVFVYADKSWQVMDTNCAMDIDTGVCRTYEGSLAEVVAIATELMEAKATKSS